MKQDTAITERQKAGKVGMITQNSP